MKGCVVAADAQAASTGWAAGMLFVASKASAVLGDYTAAFRHVLTSLQLEPGNADRWQVRVKATFSIAERHPTRFFPPQQFAAVLLEHCGQFPQADLCHRQTLMLLEPGSSLRVTVYLVSA